jgi:hypothetical protein
MAAENNLIQFNSHKNIAIKEKREKKRSNKNIRCNEVRLTMPTSPELPTSNNWGWAETLKNSFTLVELDPLHKNGLLGISVITVITHSKIKRWVTTHSIKVSDDTLEKGEHYSSKQFTKRVDHEQSSWENGEKLDLA